MRKGSLAPLLVLSLLVTDTAAGGEEGCALLEELVQASVHAAATDFLPAPDSRGPARENARHPGAVAEVYSGLLTCRATVEAVTRAFGRALWGLGMPVAWNFPPHPGDFCWSGNLDHCYPGGAPGVPALPPERLAFVHDAWKGVRQAVAVHMPRGAAGGVASFSESSLAGELSTSLRASVEGPLYLAYPRETIRYTR